MKTYGKTGNKIQQSGYTTFELMLSCYIVIIIIIASVLIVVNHQQITKETTPNYALAQKQNDSKTSVKPKSDPIPAKYVKQTMEGHDFKVTLNFDPNAYGIVEYTPGQKDSNGVIIPGTGNDELDIIGDPLGSSNQIVVSVSEDQSSETGLLSPSVDPLLGLASEFNAIIMEQSYTVYGYNDSVPGAIVNVQVDSSWYTLRIDNYVRGGAKNIPINTSVEQTILSSISIEQ